MMEFFDPLKQTVGVYIRTNDNGNIIEVDSDYFIPDATGWIKIDEGIGRKYLYAKVYYFDDKLIDDYGYYVYSFVNGSVVKRDKSEAELIRAKFERIDELKRLLADSDYKFRKFMEGWMTEEEYAPIKAQCQAWRDEINEIENDILV